MKAATLEQLLDLFEVRLDAFAVCEVGKGWGLNCCSVDAVVVHFVLSGEGSIQWEQGSLPLTPGTVVVVPPHVPKTILGRGPLVRIVDTDSQCSLTDGMVKFQACEGEPGLVLGCASVTATVGEGFALFQQLRSPIAEMAADKALLLLFAAMLGEVSNPAVGTRAILCALMKHVLIVLLRIHLERRGRTSPLKRALADPQLGKVVIAVASHPDAPHSVASLALLAGMSRSCFTRHFTASYGRSPMDFVQLERLRTAERLLQGSNLPIKSIAARVGYMSRSHFTRAFRKEYGVDPTRFRAGGQSIAPAERAAPDHRMKLSSALAAE